MAGRCGEQISLLLGHGQLTVRIVHLLREAAAPLFEEGDVALPVHPQLVGVGQHQGVEVRVHPQEMLGLRYDSEEARRYVEELTELIALAAYEATDREPPLIGCGGNLGILQSE